MKKVIALTLILISLISFNLYAGYYADGNILGGDGTSGNPFQISDAEDIDSLMSRTDDWNKYFILTQDINCSGYTWSTNNPSPIGTNFLNPFSGNFDGMNHSISNISINKSLSNVGFFGYVSNSYISNLRLININATGISNVGCFCGECARSIITKSSSTGVAYGSSYVGGFCGANFSLSNGVISECYSTANATANDNLAGGFCGYNGNYSNIEKCYSTGNATSPGYVGGFCGANDYYSSISNCFSLGNANGSYAGTGGFCGKMQGSTIQYCYSLGRANVTEGSSYLGGFLGEYVDGTFLCNFWGFSGATINDIGYPEPGDLPNDQIRQLSPAEFAVQSNFSCFDFNTIWIMLGEKPMMKAFIPTLTEWAVIIFISLIAIIGSVAVWKRLF